MVFSPVFLPAQEKDTIYNDTFKSTYKLDLFRAFQGTIQLSREAIFGKRLSFQVGLMGTYASTRGLAKPYLKAQDFVFKDMEKNQTYKLDNVEVLGYGLNLQVRKYMGKQNTTLRGYYMAPELFFRQLSLKSNIVDYDSKENRNISKVLYLGYMGYLIGHQKVIRDVVAIDSYLGGGFFFSKYQDENKLTQYRNNYQIDYTGFYLNAGILIGITK